MQQTQLNHVYLGNNMKGCLSINPSYQSKIILDVKLKKVQHGNKSYAEVQEQLKTNLIQDQNYMKTIHEQIDVRK